MKPDKENGDGSRTKVQLLCRVRKSGGSSPSQAPLMNEMETMNTGEENGEVGCVTGGDIAKGEVAIQLNKPVEMVYENGLANECGSQRVDSSIDVIRSNTRFIMGSPNFDYVSRRGGSMIGDRLKASSGDESNRDCSCSPPMRARGETDDSALSPTDVLSKKGEEVNLLRVQRSLLGQGSLGSLGMGHGLGVLGEPTAPLLDRGSKD